LCHTCLSCVIFITPIVCLFINPITLKGHSPLLAAKVRMSGAYYYLHLPSWPAPELFTSSTHSTELQATH
jgi:hypothetical protein